MGTLGLFEKPEPIKVSIYEDEYRELVKKACLYDELLAGNIALNTHKVIDISQYSFLDRGDKDE